MMQKRRLTAVFFAIILIEFRVICVIVFGIHIVLCDAQSVSETLIMRDFSLTQKFNRITHIGVIHKTQDVVIGDARLLLCCNAIRTT